MTNYMGEGTGQGMATAYYLKSTCFFFSFVLSDNMEMNEI